MYTVTHMFTGTNCREKFSSHSYQINNKKKYINFRYYNTSKFLKLSRKNESMDMNEPGVI